MIAVFGILLGVAYYAAIRLAITQTYFVTGFVPILLTAFVCFCIVCLFDSIFERFSSRLKQRREGSDNQQDS